MFALGDDNMINDFGKIKIPYVSISKVTLNSLWKRLERYGWHATFNEAMALASLIYSGD